MTPAPKAISGKYQRDVITQVELQTMMELRREHEKLNAVFQRWLFDIALPTLRHATFA